MDLERGRPTTPADNAAPRRAASAARGDPVDYLELLGTFRATAPEELRARRGLRGDEPFELH